MKQYAIRGATTIAKNETQDIKNESIELIKQMMSVNDVQKNDCVYLKCSITTDITRAHPAKFIRESGFIGETPLFSCNEPEIENQLKLCIRLMLLIQKDDNENFKANHIYLNGAKTLRPDLVKLLKEIVK